MPQLANDLWSLAIGGHPEIDPADLAAAVQEQVAAEEPLDYRTRLLIRDSINALRDYWGQRRVEEWLSQAAHRDVLETICREEFERPGFTLIRRRLMEKTQPDAIRGVFTEIGSHLRESVRMNVGGSSALILPGYLAWHTEGIDVVDEVPEPVRTQYALLEDLKKRYGLLLAHFGSHYLPTGWENRLQYFDDFDELHVHLVDPVDIFVGKLFSKRSKDIDDLRMVAPLLDKAAIVQRFLSSTTELRKDPNLLPLAQKSWSIVFGEALPQ
jgi:hypothetical protein